jgi:hypothetical protein
MTQRSKLMPSRRPNASATAPAAIGAARAANTYNATAVRVRVNARKPEAGGAQDDQLPGGEAGDDLCLCRRLIDTAPPPTLSNLFGRRPARPPARPGREPA